MEKEQFDVFVNGEVFVRVDRGELCLYAVTDRHWLGEDTLEHQVELAILGGATFVQFREKQLQGEELLEQGRRVRKVCRKHHVPFIVNDNASLALALDADGVHVGQGDMEVQEARRMLGPDKIIGVSAHNVEEALEAWRNGADYLGAGAVFATGTKGDASPLSRETLGEICRAVEIPVVAIGGIDAGNAAELAGTGISGVAVVHGIFGQEDIQRGTAELKNLVMKMLSWG